MKNPNSKSRRKLLLAVTAGSTVGAAKLPEKWVGPIVNSVTLPAHAATTDSGGEPTDGPFAHRQNISLSRNFFSVSVDPKPSQGIVDALLSTAHAGIEIDVPAVNGDLCITSPDGSSYTANLLTTGFGTMFFAVSGTVGVPTVLPNTGDNCNSPSLTLTVNSVNADGAVYSISGFLFGNGMISGGSGCPVPSNVLTACPIFPIQL